MQQHIIKITSEKQAIEYIKKSLEEDLPENIKIEFSNWPKLELIFEGEGFDSTITPSIMKSLIEVQEGLNRTYSKLVYGKESARFLKEEDKLSIEFKAKVEDGCSHITIPLEKFFEKLGEELGKKMDAKTVLGMVALASVAWVGDTAVKAHFDSEARTKEVQQETLKAVTLSKEETRRMEVVTQALTTFPEVKFVNEEAKKARISVLGSGSNAQSIEFNGVKINQEDAETLSSSTREKSKDVQLNGNYRILYVDTSHPTEIKIKLKSLFDDRTFVARFQDDSIDKQQTQILQEAEWSKSKVFLSINAVESRNEILRAVIISVKAQPKLK